jgi:hypothetical protein
LFPGRRARTVESANERTIRKESNVKSSILIATVAAAVLSASAAACPAYPPANTSGSSQQPIRGLLHSADTSVCTPRAYWFPAQCTSDRSVTSAARTTRGNTSHTHMTGSETCTARTYWFAAHCE